MMALACAFVLAIPRWDGQRMLTARNRAPSPQRVCQVFYTWNAPLRGGSGSVDIGLVDDRGGRSWQTRKPVPS